MNGFFASTCGEIDNYLEAGKPLKLPYELVGGTPLQRAVWLELSRLRYGETISYTALAEKVGFPRAVRAIASACGANPLPLVIPCHRVISKDGSLGGFSLGGLEVKERLLSLEAKLRFAAA
ncbi:MAG: methylated-DNA--[protein]-cysteine S-methyltransferase [Alphaproteobacteria bacterium]|nr:methylated-DNA--[protein]-cysteine S-methyltransferase [Alphaproteobacteria bacterium]